MDLVDKLLNGNQRALARAITYIENQHPQYQEILSQIQAHLGKAHIIGITGPPGAGKSSVVNRLVTQMRNSNLKVGVIAVDPSSPFSGGAVLGDRIRMLNLTGDDGVYIRSMASRGHLGGLASETFNCARLLDAFGFDKILIETVGAGQSEVDIVKACDTTVVLTVPGFGDDVQMIKAGIMEIADIFVVNKSDLPNSKQLVMQIRNMLDLIPEDKEWNISIVQTSAQTGLGIDDLLKEINKHWTYLTHANKLREGRIARKQQEIIELVLNRVKEELLDQQNNSLLATKLANINIDEPAYEIAEKLYNSLKKAE